MQWLANISALSILPVLLVSLLLIKNRSKGYWPFIALILAGSATEAVSYLIYIFKYSNLFFLNLFILVQVTLILLQLRNWGFFKEKSPVLAVTLAAVFIVWLIESWYKSGFNSLNNYTMVFAAFIIIVSVVLYMSQLLMEKVNNLLLDTRFLLSSGFLLYFTVSLLVFIFRDQRLQMSDIFYINLWSIHNIANIIANLIYAFGLFLLCTPRKQISY